MNLLERIPKSYKMAYVLICAWYGFNYTLSTLIEWQVFRPYNTSVLWNGFYMLEVVCLAIALILAYSYYLSRHNYVFQAIGHVLGLVVHFMIMSFISYYFDYYLDGLVFFDDYKEYMLDLLSWDAMRFYDQYIIAVAVFHIIRYIEFVRRRDQEKSELAIKNKDMELALLKSQINPHFLFNTLNSISMLISTSKEKARKVITQLSDVFRYALDSHTGMLVKLEDELNFIENYIRIQQVRFGDRLIYKTDIDPECKSMEVPPMILQPLVENSVKYGIAPKDDGGTIQVIIRREGDQVYFTVDDNGLGKNASKVLDGKSTGVGLKNSDRRLRSLYGDASKLKIEPRNDGYKVSFMIPIVHVYRPPEAVLAEESPVVVSE